MSANRGNNPPERTSPGPQRIPTGNFTQVNILFPSEQVELPSAEKFKAFPPEAQKAILAAFDREQIERHAWLKNQQTYEHQFNMQSGSQYFFWKMTGTICGTIIAISALFAGAYLVKTGASATGVALIIASIGGLVISTIYGIAQKKTSKGDAQPASASDALDIQR